MADGMLPPKNMPSFSIKAGACSCRLEWKVSRIWSKNGMILVPQPELVGPTIKPCAIHQREE